MSESEAKLFDSYTLNLFADYYQLNLQDEEVVGDQPDDWGDQLVTNMIAVAPGIIGIGTARNVTVPVQVDLLDRRPSDDFDSWDHVTETSLDVPSGRMVIAGCSDYFPEATRIPVAPGSYRVRINARGLGKISENGLEGDDQYHVVIWPEEHSSPQILKQWSSF
jgi:hypothetical protein